MIGMNDRKVRKFIEELRNDGHVIYADKNGKGYKLASDEYEHNCTNRMYESRIESEVTTVKAMFGHEVARRMLRKQIEIIDEEVKNETYRD